MAHLYILDNGSTIAVEGGRFIIKQKKELVRSIPKESVESISIFGNSSLTTPCIQELLSADIPVCFFSSRGKYYGRLVSTSGDKVTLLKKQFDYFAREEAVLLLSKKLVNAKINNQYIVLRRYLDQQKTEYLRQLSIMRETQKKVEHAQTTAEIMGYEGMAAKMYFDLISRIIQPEFRFRGRNRRPPTDPFNSLLSLGYTLLLYEVMAKIENTGLNPYCGILHQDRAGSPALASDLMEEWRAVLVDSTVLSMIQGRELHLKDFVNDEETGGVFLTNEGMRKFINKFERKLNTRNKYLSYEAKEYSFRQAMEIQCRKIVECIDQESPEFYAPIRIR